ncbi:unnamed protein product [Fraxinus pennsylvanica]|uniref:Conserved oligomeric Golgi complex subunit 7 n=1 Tax=Fraxinus pennsylvanica TaxID=56036 RepID=A0AAD2EC48_9LAMI|nr:unnamed protein product [Fraxinus pennsylvanica]
MERVVLSGETAGLDLRGVTTRIIGVQGVELNETVRRMEESVLQVILLLEAAAQRCINFVGGSEAYELILKEMGSDRKEGASHARKVESMSNEEEWSFVQGALQILAVANSLTSRFSVFEASLRSTLARLSTSLSLFVLRTSIYQNLLKVVDVDGSGELSMAGRGSCQACRCS